MSIIIPDDIQYNRRDYSIGDALELNDGMMGSQPERHPLFKLMLKYIASPFSDNNYDEIEDNLLYYLDSSFVMRLAERDSDVVIPDEETYERHINYAWEQLQRLSTEQLFNHLMNYVGDTKQLKLALTQGLLDEGKNTLIQDINTKMGTDHLLSAHTKGIESKKIFQAADKGAKYEPALDIINDILTGEDGTQNKYMKIMFADGGKLGIKHKIKLPHGKPIGLGATEITIDIDFEELFNTLFENAGIQPVKFSKQREFKKSFNKYKPHPDFPLNEEDEEIIRHIQLKQEWNQLHTEGEFKDEEYEGSLEAEEIKEEIKRGRMKDTMNVATDLLDAGLITFVKFKKLEDEGEVFPKLPYKEHEINLISDIVDWKKKNLDGTGPNEFELEVYRKESVKAKKEVMREFNTRVYPVIHGPKYGPYADRQLFLDDTWKEFLNDDNKNPIIKLDLKNAARHSRKLYDALNQDALIPREVGILQLTIISYMQSEEEIEDRKELLNDEDEEVRANSKFLLDKIFNVFKLVGVNYSVKQRYDFRDWTERKPERGNRPMEEQKPKFGKPGKSLGLTGMSEAGGQPTNISVKTNTLLYYIKRQIANLQGALNG